MNKIPRNTTIRKVWRWRAFIDEKTCDSCKALSGTIYENEEDIPKHPHHDNCRCWIEEIELDDNDNVVVDSRKQDIIHKTMAEEGGYVDNIKLIDQPTNSGITQPTLDKYNADHPDFNFPDKVKDLSPEQARQIYGEDYYDEHRIGDIDDERIANAVFDMGVMSNFNNVVKIVQKTLNDSMGTNLKTDGKIGDRTIIVLNNIPDNKIEDFMQDLKANRIEYLRGLSGWNKYGKGWTNRTNRY
jgi:lysozyme family protein